MNPETPAAEGPDSPPSGLGRQAGLVGAWTTASRAAGLARDWALVFVFQRAIWVSDAFLFAFALPNLFRNLLGEGALSSSLLPAFVEERERRGPVAAAALAWRVLSLLALGGAAVAAAAVAGLWAAEALARPEAPAALTFRLARWLFPYMPLICLQAVLGGLLQGMKRFAWPAALPVLLNLGFLAAFAWIYWGQCGGDLSALAVARADLEGAGAEALAEPPAQGAVRAATLLAAAVVATGALQVLLLWGRLRRLGIRLPPPGTDGGLAGGADGAGGAAGHEGARRVWRAFVPAALGLGAVQLNTLADKLIALWLSARSPGAQTFLHVGQRLMQLPLAVFATAVATAAFPHFAGLAARGDRRQMLERLGAAGRMSLAWTLPAAAGLAALADPVARLLFQAPDLGCSHADVYRMARAASFYALGLPFLGLVMLYTRWLYAAGDYRGPVRVAAAMVGLNLGLNLALVRAPDFMRLWKPGLDPTGFLQPQDIPLWRGGYAEAYGLPEGALPATLGEGGLALATAVTGLAQMLALRHMVRRRALREAGPAAWKDESSRSFSSAWRMALAALGTGTLAHWFAGSIPYEPEWPMRALRVAAPCLLGALAWAGLALAIPVPEVEAGIKRIFGRGKKPTADG